MKSDQNNSQSQRRSVTQKAGVVVYHHKINGEIEVLLITARTNPQSWIFPVGTVDPGETLQETAARECEEESGYIVEVGPKLGMIDLDKGDSIDRLTFFVA